ncbi:MAG: hypothetical protein BA861_06950 [Desulfobacterales bacterium S3730MH5]|nr:MAG: hypothetical protein BA861_06950 [Desulfobacterales bacterium S3730MH5]OEU78601.1 MAG: hypothetical protein BA873_10995 [Desulfobulbaceae bacterium C00003063]OEU81064.1 MAG: hypothetical protein BA865_04860 [Desulfobacterales bacterium S5133MH4]
MISPKKNLCDPCVLSEAGGEKIIETTRSNPTAQVAIIQFGMIIAESKDANTSQHKDAAGKV